MTFSIAPAVIGSVDTSTVQPPKRTYEQLEAEIAALKEQVATQTHDMSVLQDANVMLMQQVAALGWQPLTPETEWVYGSQVGYWYNGRFVSCLWPIGWDANRVLGAATTTYYYLRLNPPAQETSR